ADGRRRGRRDLDASSRAARLLEVVSDGDQGRRARRGGRADRERRRPGEPRPHPRRDREALHAAGVVAAAGGGLASIAFSLYRSCDAPYGVQTNVQTCELFCTTMGMSTWPASCLPLRVSPWPWNCKMCGPFESMRVSRLTVCICVASWNSVITTSSTLSAQCAVVVGPAFVTRPVIGTTPFSGASSSVCAFRICT